MKKFFIAIFLILLLNTCGAAVKSQTTGWNIPLEQTSSATGITPSILTLPDLSTPQTLTVLTHDSFAVSEDVIAAFEQLYNVKVTFIKAGDAGSMLNRAILTRDAPIADVLYGVDNTFLSRALEEGIFEPYRSTLLLEIPEAYKLDPSDQALPVDYGDVCINYDIAYFEQHELPLPQSLQDLTRPEYKGLLVMENPATSSPGLALLLASVADFGDPGYLEFWQQMRTNDLVVVDDWTAAYYTNFSAASGQGEQPLVVSYSSSPAAEVYFADPPRSDSPTASITQPGTCFRQVEFAGILKGTPNRYLAEKFIDFMLGITFQEDIPLQMFMYPVNRRVILPQVFIDFAILSSQPVTMDPVTITAGRDGWIRGWTNTVLK
jgi:thiamine transport system substrate-binding protein